MKATLEFQLPDEHEEFQDAIEGSKNKLNFEQVWEYMIRPFYKHGFPDSELQSAIDKNPEVAEVIFERLSEIYKAIKNEE